MQGHSPRRCSEQTFLTGWPGLPRVCDAFHTYRTTSTALCSLIIGETTSSPSSCAYKVQTCAGLFRDPIAMGIPQLSVFMCNCGPRRTYSHPSKFSSRKHQAPRSCVGYISIPYLRMVRVRSVIDTTKPPAKLFYNTVPKRNVRDHRSRCRPQQQRPSPFESAL